MKLRKLLSLAVVLWSMTYLSSGQANIRVAADSSSGTYAETVTEIVQQCSDDSGLSVQIVQSHGGAPGNLESLLNNQADVALAHSDVYSAQVQGNPDYGKLFTLLALYPEHIHVFVKRDTGLKTSRIFGSAIVFNSLADLKGYKVGAAGGGVFTARLLLGMGEGGFQVVQYDSGDQVIQALSSGEIQAAIFVGAAPLAQKTTSKLPASTYKLIPIGESIASRVSGIYRQASFSYQGYTNGTMKTLAPIATLFTKRFSTPAKNEALAKLRSCFYAKLPELQDNGSRRWSEVAANDHGPLNNWLELGSSPTVKPAVRRRPSK